MKELNLNCFALALALIPFSVGAWAQQSAPSRGGVHTHGGDTVKLRNLTLNERMAELEAYVRDEAEDLVSGYFQYRFSIKPKEGSPAIQRFFHDLEVHGADYRLHGAKYDFRRSLEEPCLDQASKPTPLSVIPGRLDASICVNLPLWAQQKPDTLERFALLAHEQAHRFGEQFEDATHEFAEFVRRDAERYLDVMASAKAQFREDWRWKVKNFGKYFHFVESISQMSFFFEGARKEVLKDICVTASNSSCGAKTTVSSFDGTKTSEEPSYAPYITMDPLDVIGAQVDVFKNGDGKIDGEGDGPVKIRIDCGRQTFYHENQRTPLEGAIGLVYPMFFLKNLK
jgi:hypothetical protein